MFTAMVDAAGRLRHWFRSLLGRRLVWVTSQRVDMTGSPSAGLAWVAIIGREHYEQTRRRYPIRRWFDLARVLRLESVVGDDRMALIGPLQNDQREVTCFRFRPGFDRDSVRALFWVPETLLLRDVARRHGVVTVSRENFEYFLSAEGDTLISGGAIRTAALFGIATGSPDEGSSLTLTAGELVEEFVKSIGSLDPTSWWSMRSRVTEAHATRFLRAISVVAVLATLLYLGVVSAYLSVFSGIRERQLASLGPEVSTLAARQRSVDVMAGEIQGLARVAASVPPAWPVWEAVSTVWRSKGAVYSIALVDDVLTLRCTSPVATDTLEALAALKGYTDVRFDSAVRAGGLGQEFVVSLRRTGPAAGGGGT